MELDLARSLFLDILDRFCDVFVLVSRQVLLEIQLALLFEHFFLLLLWHGVVTVSRPRLLHELLGLIQVLLCADWVARLTVQSGYLSVRVNHLLASLTEHALLDRQEVMPHVEGVPIAAHALKEGR